MKEQSATSLSLEIKESDYRGDIHSSLPPAVYSALEEGQDDYIEVFGLTDLNRYLSEGSQAGSGWPVEDFAISSSSYDGELIVGQCITAREKENNFEHNQLMSLKYTLMNFHPETYDRLNGSYIIAVDTPAEEVREEEQRIRREINQTGSAELDINVKEVEEIPPSVEESMKMLNQVI